MIEVFTISLAFGCGLFGAWGVARYAERLSLMDVPCWRSSHSRPTPKGGGVGVLLAFVLLSCFGGLSVLVILSVTVLALVSLLGDRQELTPLFRLFVQFFCALCALWRIGFEASIGTSFPEMIVFMLPALVFIVGSANFYNFMDGINGIAGIAGVVGFAGLAGLAVMKGRTDISIASLALTGACAGFLPLNITRAKVFMGDVGSVLLGFCFALFVVALSRSVLDFLVACSLMFTFYMDEIWTMIQRLKHGDSLFQPHKRHLYQVLVNEFGTEHWKVSVGYGVVQLIVFSVIFWLSQFGLIVTIIGFAVVVGTWCLVDLAVKQKCANNKKS